jgi:hypothetical protein
MATLVEFRAKHPEYNDMPDLALADALHKKFYADVPKPDFYQSVGLFASPNQIPGGATPAPVANDNGAAVAEPASVDAVPAKKSISGGPKQ